MQILVCKHLSLLCKSGKAGKPKQRLNAGNAGHQMLRRAVRIMKITAVILFAACLHVHASGYGQRVSLSAKDQPLEKVFKEIQKQTGYNFLYNSNILENARNVTITVQNASVNEALDLCLKDQAFNYKIRAEDNTIVIKPKGEVKTTSQLNALPPDPIEVRGVITDENGAPAPGVNIVVRGTSKGTTTNLKGEFVLNGVDENAVLLITSVGYDRQEVLVKNKSFITTQLKVAVGNLDEVQIIAYGQTTKRLQTGNVNTIKANEIAKQNISNPMLALQGRVPGLFVSPTTGIPGTGLTLLIQGQNSITKGNDPLIVIDGVPYLSQNLLTVKGDILGTSGNTSPGKVGNTNGNPLSYVNPSDIESIEVLKDADATAIYGARAANGAILITTKKGLAGQTKADINLQYGWGKVGHFLDLLNTMQYMEMRNEAKRNDNASIFDSDYDLNGLWDTTRYTDWQKVLIGGTAHYSQYNASISGGTSNVQYIVAGTYRKETTVYPGNFSNRKNSAHFNINSVSSNQRFHLQFIGNYMSDNSILPRRDFTQDIFLAPVAPELYNEDGTLNWQPDPNVNGNSSWNNPLSQIFNVYETNTSNLISNIVLSYRIAPGLEAKSSFGYTSLSSNEFLGNLITAIKPEERTNYTRSAVFTFNTVKSWIIEPQLNYKNSLWKGKINILLGSSMQKQNNDGKAIIAEGQANDQLLKDINSATTLSRNGSDISIYKYNGVFGRINYNIGDKYIVNLTGRRDGSSRFGQNNKFHNFRSIGAAWIFTMEEFAKKSLPFISFGKFRGSYGSTGSDQIENYSYLNLYYNTTPGNPYQGGPSLVTFSPSNPHLQWEKTKKLQVGIDLGFWTDRALFTVNYVRNRSSNQLLFQYLPSLTGFTNVITNFPALVQNTSWEISVATENFRSSQIKWSSSINLTIPSNKLIKFPDFSESAYKDQLIIGEALDIRRTFNFYGVDPSTGTYLFTDKNGDPTNSLVYPDDAIVKYSTFPKLYGGFQNTLKYKGFELVFLLQFTKQNYFNFYETFEIPGYFAGGKGNQPTTVLNRWQKPGDITNVQRYNSDYSISPFAGDRTFEDASFIRLKNFSLTYTLGKNLIKKAHMRNMGVFVNAQNLFTITSYKGLDPETLSEYSLPPLRIVTVGLDVSF